VLIAPQEQARHLLLLLGLLTAALVLALSGTAQAAEVTAKSMKVSVWPEYDDPRVLVILQAELDESVDLPATVSFNFPTGAEIGMACEVNAAGSHACKPYRLEDNGDYKTLFFEITAERKVFFEYYYEAFPAGTGERAFDFVFKPTFAAANLQLEVQEPARSTDFSLEPAFNQTAKDAEGLVYHVENYSNIGVAEDVPVKVSYVKNDTESSVKPKDASAGAGGATAASGTGGNGALFIVLAAIGFGTLMFGGYKMFKPAAAAPAGRSASRRTGRSTAPTRNVAPGTRKRAGSAGGRTVMSKFCISCGSSLRHQDRFCPDCGEEQA
jgi:hypothetical protein